MIERERIVDDLISYGFSHDDAMVHVEHNTLEAQKAAARLAVLDFRHAVMDALGPLYRALAPSDKRGQ